MNDAYQQGTLSPSVKAECNAKIADLRAKIQAKAQQPKNTPIYYATPYKGLLREGEDNPLAYMSEVAAEGSKLGLYDIRVLQTAGVEVTPKDDQGWQVRIHCTGEELRKACVAVLGVPFERH